MATVKELYDYIKLQQKEGKPITTLHQAIVDAYEADNDEKKTKEIGFIAQDVQEVVPELVTYAEDIDEYGVKYGNATALLVEAVKELTKQVNILKKELEEIKNV